MNITGGERKHGEKWTSEELEIVYKNYSTKTIRQVAEMIPTRSVSAVKNKIKLIKFGKYKKNKRRSENAWKIKKTNWEFETNIRRKG